MIRLPLLVLVLVLGLALLAGCGGSKSSTPPAATTATPPPATTTAATSTAATSTSGGPGALQGEAQAKATGDIPDNQAFLTYRNTAAGYSMKYPEGWAQQGSGDNVTFRDKNNIVRVVVTPGGPVTATEVKADVAALKNVQITKPAAPATIGARPAFKVSYTTESAPNPVTGKRVKLVVDRYYLWRGGKRAVVDLGTPEGVDNVDAYRMMIESFGWS